MRANTNAAGSAIDRLHTRWIVSLVVLSLLLGSLTLLVAGQLRRQAEIAAALRADVEALQKELGAVRNDLRTFAAQAARAPARASEPRPPARAAEAASKPAASAPSTAGRPAPAAPGEPTLTALLGAALGEVDVRRPRLLDREAAVRAATLASRTETTRDLAPAQWLRLAILTRLLDRDSAAEEFAARVRAAGQSDLAYLETSAWRMLELGRGAEAVAFAQRAFDSHVGEPRAGLLLAEAHRALGNAAAARRGLRGVKQSARFEPPDRIRAAGLLVWLEDWAGLSAAIDALQSAPRALADDVAQLRAVAAIQAGRLAEALAILDDLLERRPQDYDLMTWRGVALLDAGQVEAARAALAHAEQHTARPEAWYWRGVLEMRAGDATAARSALKRALAASTRHSPSLEALAVLALNEGDAAAALDALKLALDADAERGVTHLLVALAHARSNRAGDAQAALAAALALEPSLREQAEAMEALAPYLPYALSQPAETQPATETP